MMLREREKKKKNEDVSFNLARRFFFCKARGEEATTIAAEHVCLCSGTQRRLEKV